MKTIPDTPIVIEGIDKIGPEGSRFLTRFCSNSTVSPKPKVLLTCRQDPDIKEIIVGVPCIIIEYDKERQEYLNSLRYDDTRYDKIEKEHHDTLKWLWEHEQYRAWSSTSHSDLLFIEGKPGSGKSTLTKYFKDNLLERESPAKQAIVGSFFYSYRDGKLQRDHSNMLRSILYDVLHQNETFFFHFQSLYRKMLQHGAWSYDSLKKIFLSFKEHPVKERLYLIIDAIDESDTTDRCDIIQLLHQICTTKKLCIVKVFIASRPIPWLSHRVSDIKNIIRLQDENEPDILKFTESFLDEELKLSTTSHKDIKDYKMHNARGVFVWVRLVQMELLKYHATGFHNQDINAFLHSLPKELDEFYERMLRELEDKYEQRDVNDGVRMFRLVLFAYRPLSIAEIQQALAIPDDLDAEYSPSDESFEDRLIDDIVKRIISCGGNFLDIRGCDSSVFYFNCLANIHTGNDILQFTHQTARTFFSRLLEPTATSKFRMNEDDAHRRISITCIRYLMLCVARSTSENEPPSTKSWEPAHFEKYAEYLNHRPFIDYALCHFQQHKNDCVLRPKKRKNDCHRCVYDE
ncbi:hypothetical protein K440DRAFT_603411 [Wilcoxina mikolae CBS 423.85]|nr:hypothetical protein K440DRAFT_603411 [Wilcoxina mikolae CBS 423.85]